MLEGMKGTVNILHKQSCTAKKGWSSSLVLELRTPHCKMSTRYESRRASEEHRPRVFENMVLRNMFGSKREEATGGRKIVHDEELHGLCSSSNQE